MYKSTKIVHQNQSAECKVSRGQDGGPEENAHSGKESKSNSSEGHASARKLVGAAVGRLRRLARGLCARRLAGGLGASRRAGDIGRDR